MERARCAEHYRKAHVDAPGQKDLFTGDVRRSSKVQQKTRWITLKPHDGGAGTHVQVSGSGDIVSGPDGLKGRNLSHMGATHSHKPAKHDPIAHLRADDGVPIGPTVMHVDKLKIDPQRFQYKVSGINHETGTNTELRKVKQYKPELGGQLLVWEDPADGETYVVNGHHRHELASRSPKGNKRGEFNGQMSVYYVDAKTPEEARAHGALANIAEGRGTAVDAAKFLRDTNGTLEDFEKHGVSPSGAVAQAALTLSKLSPGLFQKLANGGMTEGRAKAIAAWLPNHDAQDHLANFIEKAEVGRSEARMFSDGKVASMARATASAKPMQKSADARPKNLFDEWFETNPIEQRAEISDHIRRKLASEKRTYKQASSGKRKAALESVGENKVDVEANRQRAGEASSILEEYDHRENHSGHAVALTLDEHAERLFNEPRKRESILADALRDVRKHLAGEGIESTPDEAAQSGAEGSSVQPVRADGQGRGDQDGSVPSDRPDQVTKMSRRHEIAGRIAMARLYCGGM